MLHVNIGDDVIGCDTPEEALALRKAWLIVRIMELAGKEQAIEDTRSPHDDTDKVVDAVEMPPTAPTAPVAPSTALVVPAATIWTAPPFVAPAPVPPPPRPPVPEPPREWADADACRELCGMNRTAIYKLVANVGRATLADRKIIRTFEPPMGGRSRLQIEVNAFNAFIATYKPQ
jgi:hypothetical protein